MQFSFFLNPKINNNNVNHVENKNIYRKFFLAYINENIMNVVCLFLSGTRNCKDRCLDNRFS